MKSLEDAFYEGLASKPEIKEAQEVSDIIKPVTQKNIFTHPDSHPVVLDMLLMKQFRLEWMTWLGDTLFKEIELSFKTSISDSNKLKIQAVATMHVIDAFWDKWEIFEKTILALNGIASPIRTMFPPDVPLLMSGVDVANMIRKEEFSEEVGRYSAACFLFENVFYAPPPLDFCQPYIVQPQYKCKDCGKIGSALPPWDGLCDSCVRRFEQEKPFSFKPDPEAVKQGRGKNVEVSPTYDYEPTKKRFNELESLPAEELAKSIKEVPEDIQAAKLIIATDYVTLKRKQLKDQLTSLRGWVGLT